MRSKLAMNSEVFNCECGDHAWFSLTRGYVCLVDVELGPAFSCWKWRAAVDNGNVYAARTSWYVHQGKGFSHIVYAHQMVLATAKHLVADHISGNGLDNRRRYLRALTPQENAHAQRKKAGASSKRKGVSARYGKWFAYIQIGGKQVGLGLFAEEADAVKARQAAERLFYPGVAA